MHWNDIFLQLFDRCVAEYRGGNRHFASYYGDNDLSFLASIGCRQREFFDFVEDYCDDGTPSPGTALLVTAVRRDYFLIEQAAAPWNGPLLTRDEVPSFGDALDGIAYLPRIIAKARAKLRGALDPDLMFCCGGDRNFFRKHGHLHPADFLRIVWAAGDDDGRIVQWVRGQMN
ncbi:MAG: DUF5069 domain-containing protein [Luteolibacter sp.]